MSAGTLLEVRETRARRFDPRVRLLWMFGLSIAVIATPTLAGLAAIGVIVALVWLLCGVLRPMLHFTVRAIPFAIFLAALSAISAVFGRYGLGAIIDQPRLVLPSAADWLDGTIKATRFLIMVSAAKFLFLTTDFAELSGGVRSFKRPWLGQRLNSLVEIAAFVLGFSFQSVPLMIDELNAVIEAERGRGIDVNAGSRIETVRAYLRMTPTVFLRCLTIGQFTVMALINYRFNPFAPRSMYREFRYRRHDWLATLAIVGCLAALLVYQGLRG